MRNGQICLSESIVEFDLTRARVRVRANEVRPSHRIRKTMGSLGAPNLLMISLRKV
jgi:hypothetical protein